MNNIKLNFLSRFSSLGFICLSTASLVSGSALAELPQANVLTSSGEVFLTESRTLDTYTDYVVNPENLELSRYGGWKARRVTATGFFRVEKIDGRWWAIDPEGYLYIVKAANSVDPDNLNANEIYDLLLDNGFNGTGRWSEDDNIIPSRQISQPLAYTPTLNFAGSYDARGSSEDLDFPVFDDEFEAHVNEYAADIIAPYVNDPAVFGYMSDNELGWYGNLEEHLALNDDNNKNYTTAISFLEERGKTANDWGRDDEDAYVGLMAETFYSAVSSAIKRVDPNHMYLGSRANSGERYNQAFMEAAGKYVDVFSMNHYSRWGSYDININQMADRLNKPMMITEFYAQQVGHPDPATGAGFRVADQKSRGLFYHNFVTTLLETKNIVGFHWFKFQDDGNGNKGIVDLDGNPYSELLGYMNDLHIHMYDFINYVDTRSPADAILSPEADAHYTDDRNHGDSEDLRIEYNSSRYGTRTYMRFDVSQLQNSVSSAIIDLKSFRTTGGTGNYQAEFVEDDSWGEMSITRSNNPSGSTILHKWAHGADLSIDVTDQVNDAIRGDGKLSIRLSSEQNTFRTPFYASRESENVDARPTLSVNYAPVVDDPIINNPVINDIQEEVTIFDFSRFNTTRDFITLGVGVHNNLERWNNDISSIEVTEGLRVKACADTSGTVDCMTFTESVSQLPGTLHNKISYLSIEPITASIEPTLPITVYDWSSYRRESASFTVGEYTNLARWDNDIGSIRIPDGLSVTACVDEEGTVECATFTNDTDDLPRLSNRISYLLVESIR